MAGILSNLRSTIIVSLILAVLMYALYYVLSGSEYSGAAVTIAFLRWLHVISGVMWIGLLWYFNFVQIPNMAKIPDDQKPAIGKVIAPAALFWFRWGAAATLLTGLALAGHRGYLVETLTIGAMDGFANVQHVFLGLGMWMGIIMAFNVWVIIWPNQKIALGLIDAPAEAKPAAARKAMLFSRTNTLLSLPMLVAMAGSQTLFG
ncbi:MAG: urate hydroxylase PuuD [Robiginitomaculum sp.]|nr:urate hydroxylase PuuD [Robiginitomaculum sp.]MDQ7077577.1 urate hydroxylase PuuD [Robiginitomaculum sp.]